MERYSFETRKKTKGKILEVKDFLLDHDFHYQFLANGMKVTGTIAISYLLKKEFQEEPDHQEIEIDLFVELNRIDCLKEVKLVIEDFDFSTDEDELYIKVRTKLLGNNEDFVHFAPTSSKAINDEIICSLLSKDAPCMREDHDVDEDFLKKMEDFLQKKNVDIIATSFQSNQENDEEDVVEIAMDYDAERNKMIESIKKTVGKIKQNISIFPPKTFFEGDVKQQLLPDDPIAVHQELLSEPTTDIKKKEPIFEERYVTTYLYYRVKKEETLASIASRFHVEEQAIVALNGQKSFVENTLIKIPR